jgi:hypothetical protein
MRFEILVAHPISKIKWKTCKILSAFTFNMKTHLLQSGVKFCFWADMQCILSPPFALLPLQVINKYINISQI